LSFLGHTGYDKANTWIPGAVVLRETLLQLQYLSQYHQLNTLQIASTLLQQTIESFKREKELFLNVAALSSTTAAASTISAATPSTMNDIETMKSKFLELNFLPIAVVILEFLVFSSFSTSNFVSSSSSPRVSTKEIVSPKSFTITNSSTGDRNSSFSPASNGAANQLSFGTSNTVTPDGIKVKPAVAPLALPSAMKFTRPFSESSTSPTSNANYSSHPDISTMTDISGDQSSLSNTSNVESFNLSDSMLDDTKLSSLIDAMASEDSQVQNLTPMNLNGNKEDQFTYARNRSYSDSSTTKGYNVTIPEDVTIISEGSSPRRHAYTSGNIGDESYRRTISFRCQNQNTLSSKFKSFGMNNADYISTTISQWSLAATLFDLLGPLDIISNGLPKRREASSFNRSMISRVGSKPMTFIIDEKITPTPRVSIDDNTATKLKDFNNSSQSLVWTLIRISITIFLQFGYCCSLKDSSSSSDDVIYLLAERAQSRITACRSRLEELFSLPFHHESFSHELNYLVAMIVCLLRNLKQSSVYSIASHWSECAFRLLISLISQNRIIILRQLIASAVDLKANELPSSRVLDSLRSPSDCEADYKEAKHQPDNQSVHSDLELLLEHVIAAEAIRPHGDDRDLSKHFIDLVLSKARVRFDKQSSYDNDQILTIIRYSLVLNKYDLKSYTNDSDMAALMATLNAAVKPVMVHYLKRVMIAIDLNLLCRAVYRANCDRLSQLFPLFMTNNGHTLGY
jgi:hypothetical protein